MNFNISHPFCTKLSTLFFKKTRVKLKLKTNTSCSNAEKMQKNERPNDKRKKKEYDFTEATSVCDNYNNVSYSFASLDSLFALLQIPHIYMHELSSYFSPILSSFFCNFFNVVNGCEFFVSFTSMADGCVCDDSTCVRDIHNKNTYSACIMNEHKWTYLYITFSVCFVVFVL